MNIVPCFYVIEDEKFSFYAGYCVKPKEDIDLYELCGALNSDSMEEYINPGSKVIVVGINHMPKVLKDLPIPNFTNRNQHYSNQYIL